VGDIYSYHFYFKGSNATFIDFITYALSMMTTFGYRVMTQEVVVADDKGVHQHILKIIKE
jgi:hypothetical protein